MTDSLTELLAFALDLYRAPLRYRPYITQMQPVPRDFDALLEALNKRGDSVFWQALSERLKASPEQLRNAGFFLVKRLLFAENADHYRVFGLDSNADLHQVRERYRLLMALFHPDRNHGSDEWTEQYAPRINEAYNILKNPGKRRVYDRVERSAAPWGSDVPAPGEADRGSVGQGDPGEHRESAPPMAGAGAPAAPVGERRLQLHIWFGLLLLGLIGWFGVQVYESGALKLVPRDGAGRSATKGAVVGGETPTLSSPDAAVWKSPADMEDKKKAAEPAQQVGESGMTETRPQSQAAGGDNPPVKVADAGELVGPTGECDRQQLAAPTLRDQPAGANWTVVAEKPSAGAKSQPPDSRSGSIPEQKTKEGRTPAPRPLAQAREPRKDTVVVEQKHIDLLISRFIQAYEAGDIGKFVGLFGREARSDDGVGRDLIAKRYRELFRTTHKRSMMISGVAWEAKEEGVVRIAFSVSMKSVDRGSSEPREYLGDVELLAYMDLSRLKISQFTQRPVIR